jgi:hypothetical protein
LKAEAIGALVFGVLAFVLGSGNAVGGTLRVGTQEASLVFALVFTFAVGLEVIK